MEIKRIIGGILMANCYIVSPSERLPMQKQHATLLIRATIRQKILKYIKASNALEPEGHPADPSSRGPQRQRSVPEKGTGLPDHDPQGRCGPVPGRRRRPAGGRRRAGTWTIKAETRRPRPETGGPAYARAHAGRNLPHVGAGTRLLYRGHRSSMWTWAERTWMTAVMRRWSAAS